MNFDVRSYCERLAKTDPERFTFTERPDNIGSYWNIKDKQAETPHANCWDGCLSWAMWAFIGPLADELGVDPCFYIGQWVGKSQTMTHVEAMFAAVCEKLEAAKS